RPAGRGCSPAASLRLPTRPPILPARPPPGSRTAVRAPPNSAARQRLWGARVPAPCRATVAPAPGPGERGERPDQVQGASGAPSGVRAADGDPLLYANSTVRARKFHGTSTVPGAPTWYRAA